MWGEYVISLWKMNSLMVKQGLLALKGGSIPPLSSCQFLRFRGDDQLVDHTCYYGVRICRFNSCHHDQFSCTGSLMVESRTVDPLGEGSNPFQCANFV